MEEAEIMRRLLIVEDEADLLEVYALLFELQNFDVHQAENGEIALNKLEKAKPDVVILDLFMPVMGGLEFLEVSRIKEKFPDVKVLVLSNLSDANTLEQLDELGTDKYLLKSSVSPTELLSAVNQLLQSA
jgi:two-component system response regulator